MKRLAMTCIVLFCFACLTGCSTISPSCRDTGVWVEGTWHYYQTDGSTWLFDVCVIRNGPYFEVRLSKWNDTIYRGNAFENGRMISRLQYDADCCQFYGDHYRVEDGGYFDEVIVEADGKDVLVYRGTTKSVETGQSMRRTKKEYRKQEGTEKRRP